MPMTPDERDTFVNSGDTRETSRSIMEAIACFSNSYEIAESIWQNGVTGWSYPSTLEFLSVATDNGSIPLDDLRWGRETKGHEFLPYDLSYKLRSA